jgi:hypothetical protein
MTNGQLSSMLERAARGAAGNPSLLGFSIAQAGPSGDGSQDLAESTGLPRESVLRLALCQRPRAGHWAEDLDRLACSTRIDPDTLIAVLRQLDALDELRADAQSSMLLAARRDYQAVDGDEAPADDDAPTDADPPR